MIRLALILLVALSGAAQAQSCAHTDRILELSNRVIDARDEVSRLPARRLGGDALYLILRYGDLTEAEVIATVSRLEGLADLDEILIAREIARNGAEAGLSLGGRDPVATFAGAGLSVRRAVLLSDNGASFMDLLARTPRLRPRGEFRQHLVLGKQPPCRLGGSG